MSEMALPWLMRRSGMSPRALTRRPDPISAPLPVVVAAPAPPAPSFGPTDPLTIVASATPFFFLSGDLGITIATGVSNWADQSGNGKDASQGTGGNQPARNVAALNGHDTVQGDGSNDVLVFTTLDLPAPGTTNIFLWGVGRQRTWTMNDSLYGGNSTTTTRLRQGGAGTPNVGANNGVTGPDNNGATVDVFVRLEHLFSNTIGDYIKLGSTLVTGTNTGNTNPAANVFSLFAHSTIAGGAGNIELACFAAWQGAPTAGELLLLDAWVTGYYGGTVGV